MTLDTRISQSGSNKIDQPKQRLACLTVQPAVCVCVRAKECLCVCVMYYAYQLTRPHWIICSCLFLVQQSCSKHKHFKYPLLVSFFAGFLRFTLFLSSHFLPFAILILFFGFILFFSFILFFCLIPFSLSLCLSCMYLLIFFLFVCLLFKSFFPLRTEIPSRMRKV